MKFGMVRRVNVYTYRLYLVMCVAFVYVCVLKPLPVNCRRCLAVCECAPLLPKRIPWLS